MGSESRRINPIMYVCVKSAVIRDKADGDPIYTAKFGQRVYRDLETEPSNHRIRVKFYKNKKTDRGCYGWIPLKALTHDRVVNYAKLYFKNRLDKPVAITDKRGGANVILTIDPGEKVQMIASVGNWCLTDKGWSIFDWFEKDKDMDCLEGAIEDVWEAVLGQVVHDYTSAVKRIRERRYRSANDYKECVCTIMSIRSWFMGKEYRFLYGDSGRRRLAKMEENLRVNKDWLKEQNRILDEIRKSIYPNRVVGL